MPVEIKKAPEPSDIIWENFSVPEQVKNRRRKTLILIMLVVYVVFFISIVFLYSIKNEFEVNFPAHVSCDEILTFYEMI